VNIESRTDAVGPTGCCIQAFVAMMKKPDTQEPRKTDSAKNANTPSMANVVPMTPPVYREVDREDLGPEAGVALVHRALLAGLEPGHEQSQAHRENREEVVKSDRQRELQTVDRHVTAHVSGR
jgi:hypothetical protein